MITRLEIDGFKSLRDFAVDLEPLTVFIGPNSAGKSNILDALALLSRLSSMSIEDAFKQGRGRAYDQFTLRGGKAGEKIRFAIETPDRTAAAGPPRFSHPRYELAIERRPAASGAEHLAIADEGIVSPHSGARAPWSSQSGSVAASTALRFVGFIHPASPPPAPAGIIADELQRCAFLHLDASRLRDPSERIGSDRLATDASNLPTVLGNLPAVTFGEIRADLVSLVPGIASFEIVAEGDSFRIDFELSTGDRMPARLVSDGTLRILALLTALRVEPRPSVIGIEEPENGVYPGRLRKLIEYLREIAVQEGSATQLILTTHSPVVLAALRTRPEHIRFVDLVRRDGQLVTRARPVGATGDRGQSAVSLREIDELLHAADSEIGR